MQVIKYHSDSGNRDSVGEITYDKNTPFIEVLQKANELKAILIVKTSFVNNERPGAWYIKGYKNCTYSEIKSQIEENVKNKKYTKRICYLIDYL